MEVTWGLIKLWGFWGHASYSAYFIFTHPRFGFGLFPNPSASHGFLLIENNMILPLFPSYFGREIAASQD